LYQASHSMNIDYTPIPTFPINSKTTDGVALKINKEIMISYRKCKLILSNNKIT
jgi:hypothetical protein